MNGKVSQFPIRPPTLADLPSAPPNKLGWPWTERPPKLAKTTPDGSPWPKISIVTPSYNQGQFLEETIRSVLLQGYPNLEYFIMDGGSTDNSVDIIHKYDPWITYWKSKPDRGQSHAINKGFTHSTGQIMAWLNSDDVYAPSALEIVARCLSEIKGAMLVGTSIITDSPIQFSGKLDRRRPTWEEMAYDSRTYPQPSVFWTRDLWEVAGAIDESLYYVMDYDLWLRMRMFADKLLYSDEILSYARSHPNQKGSRAHQDGKVDQFLQQRVCVALRAAIQRQERPIVWLLRLWFRRFQLAIQNKSLRKVKGWPYHRLAIRAVLTRHYCESIFRN